MTWKLVNVIILILSKLDRFNVVNIFFQSAQAVYFFRICPGADFESQLDKEDSGAVFTKRFFVKWAE
jgi:hypothetical protein